MGETGVNKTTLCKIIFIDKYIDDKHTKNKIKDFLKHYAIMFYNMILK